VPCKEGGERAPSAERRAPPNVEASQWPPIELPDTPEAFRRYALEIAEEAADRVVLGMWSNLEAANIHSPDQLANYLTQYSADLASVLATECRYRHPVLATENLVESLRTTFDARFCRLASGCWIGGVT
jgi:hypothetical protein